MKFFSTQFALSALSIAMLGAMNPALAAEDEIPEGYHRMADGTLMANSPSSATAPEGFHLMPDGTLMPNSGGGGGSLDHSGHGAHQHGAGMFMLDYKFERMYMEGLLDTTNSISPRQIVAPGSAYGFMMTPVDMAMNMHMLMAMYGVTDKLMFMVMAHSMSNSMTMLSSDGTKSTMSTDGMGDTIISGMYKGPYKLTYNLGLSIPTGSIDESGPMTHNASHTEQNVKYPYGMQLGSGTYDIKPGISYAVDVGQFGLGASYEYTARLGENKNDYKLGDVMKLDGYAKYNISPMFNTSVKLAYTTIGQIEGADADIDKNKNMSPAADAETYGGNHLDLGISLQYRPAGGVYGIGLDFVKPLYQDLWGPQMETKWMSGLTLSSMF